MSNNLARARAREAGQAWLDRTIGKATPEVLGAVSWDRNMLVAIFEAGALWADDQHAPLAELDPINPAEALRQIGEGMVDGRTIMGVDHASFDAAAEELARPVPWRTEGVADLAAFRMTTGDPRFDPKRPATINGFLYHPAKET